MMSKQEVIMLMETSTSAQEWNDNCDKVKAACDGYPDFWWETMITSGVADRILARFGESTKLKITAT